MPTAGASGATSRVVSYDPYAISQQVAAHRESALELAQRAQARQALLAPIVDEVRFSGLAVRPVAAVPVVRPVWYTPLLLFFSPLLYLLNRIFRPIIAVF